VVGCGGYEPRVFTPLVVVYTDHAGETSCKCGRVVYTMTTKTMSKIQKLYTIFSEAVMRASENFVFDVVFFPRELLRYTYADPSDIIFYIRVSEEHRS